jgi:hypothetical protein
MGVVTLHYSRSAANAYLPLVLCCSSLSLVCRRQDCGFAQLSTGILDVGLASRKTRERELYCRGLHEIKRYQPSPCRASDAVRRRTP